MSNDPAATDNTAQDEPPLAPTMRPLFSEDGRAIFGYADAAVAEAIVQKLPIYFWKHEEVSGSGKDSVQPHVGPMPGAFHRVTGLGNGKEIQPDDLLGVALTALQNALYRIQYLEDQLLDGRGFRNQQDKSMEVTH
ncbi:hypothetical protein [uncultured Sulfitobacter sp.]|uniref:hypothetical protein n=1 Tax=uncultured Sulfitobacter sp. TaxID=191468 RepID=UPI00262BD95B|nr:hypothetical protein [uncultured Sulfitobacter sp.]